MGSKPSGVPYDQIERDEIDLANSLFEEHQRMITSGKWDSDLHNRTMIQLQVAWPLAFAAIQNSGAPQPRGGPAHTNAAQPVGSPNLCPGGVDPGFEECPKCGATMDDDCAG